MSLSESIIMLKWIGITLVPTLFDAALAFFFFVFIIIMSRDENLMHITTVLCLIRDERKDLQEV